MAKTSKGGLGKGFGALLGESLMAEADEMKGISTLPMALVEPNPDQPVRFLTGMRRKHCRSRLQHMASLRRLQCGWGLMDIIRLLQASGVGVPRASVGLTEIPQ